MEKIKRILFGTFLVSIFFMFSSDMNAQTYLDGSAAIPVLQQGIQDESTAYDSLDPQSQTYQQDALSLKRKINALEFLLRSFDSSSTSIDVQLALEEYIITKSHEFTPIDQPQYDAGNYGAAETTDLRNYLFGKLTIN